MGYGSLSPTQNSTSPPRATDSPPASIPRQGTPHPTTIWLENMPDNYPIELFEGLNSQELIISSAVYEGRVNTTHITPLQIFILSNLSTMFQSFRL